MHRDPVLMRTEGLSIEEVFNLLPLLHSISKASRGLTALAVAEIGLQVGQDSMLATLRLDEPMSVSRVSDILGIRPSTVSKMADRLGARGFLVRAGSDSDRRQTFLCLTEKGVAKRDEVLAVWGAVESDLRRTNPELHSDNVQDAVRTVEAALKAKLSRLR